MQTNVVLRAPLASISKPAASTNTYTSLMQALHWGTAALLLSTYVAAWTIDDAPTAADHAWRLMLHRSLGVTILLITAIRLMVRYRTPIPPLPADIPVLQRLAARLNIIALYTQLLTQPLTGLAASLIHGDHVVLFGYWTLPAILPINRPLAHCIFQVHGIAAVAFLAAIGLHVAAALYHRFVRNDHVLAAMLPRMSLDKGRQP